MDSDYLIEQSYYTDKIDLDILYQYCMDWLNQIKARIIKEEKPRYIEALHIKFVGDKDDWYRNRDYVVFPSWRIEDMEKIIIIKICEKKKGILISLKIDPYFKIAGFDSYEKREEKWMILVKDFIGYLRT